MAADATLSLVLTGGTVTPLGKITWSGSAVVPSLNSQGQVSAVVKINNGPDFGNVVLLTPDSPAPGG